MEGKVGDRMSAADCVSVSGGVQFHGPQWNCLRLCLSFALFARSLAIPQRNGRGRGLGNVIWLGKRGRTRRWAGSPKIFLLNFCKNPESKQGELVMAVTGLPAYSDSGWDGKKTVTVAGVSL